jgi:hypothetical protein
MCNRDCRGKSGFSWTAGDDRQGRPAGESSNPASWWPAVQEQVGVGGRRGQPENGTQPLRTDEFLALRRKRSRERWRSPRPDGTEHRGEAELGHAGATGERLTADNHDSLRATLLLDELASWA